MPNCYFKNTPTLVWPSFGVRLCRIWQALESGPDDLFLGEESFYCLSAFLIICVRGVIEGMTGVRPCEVVWSFCWERSSGCVKGGKRRVAVVTKTGGNLLFILHSINHLSCKGRDHVVTIDLQNCRTESSMVYWKEYMYGCWSHGPEAKS